MYVYRHRLYSSASFAELRDPAGFGAAWGPRTCERRSPCYNFSTEAQCNWHGSSWPFETSKTLSGLANLLQGMEGTSVHVLVSPRDMFFALVALCYVLKKMPTVNVC